MARVKNIDDSGLVALTQAKPYVEPILKKNKKAELIKAKMTGVLWKLLQNQQVYCAASN
jgi:peptidyl-prolyl cis-trans isomerase D